MQKNRLPDRRSGSPMVNRLIRAFDSCAHLSVAAAINLKIFGRKKILAALFPLATLALATPLPAQTGIRPNLTVLPAVPGGHQAQLQLRGQSNLVYQIEASTNLTDWTAIAQRACRTGMVMVADSQAGKFPRRYYRAVALDAPPLANKLTAMGANNFAPDKILVRPLPGADLSTVNLTLSVQVLKVFPAFNNLQVIKVPPGMSASTLIAQYQKSGLVQYAEPDFYVHAFATPNDYYYTNGSLWDLHNTGQAGGKINADIDAPDAWNIQNTASNIIVAIVDTGVRYTHEDLAANMWVNPLDGSHGTNVIAGNADPNDDYGHGTHVAGTIGAAGNNIVGVVGVAWRVQIMACKFLDSTGNGTTAGAIVCLDYARVHGAKIVNASWGAPAFTSQALHDAIAGLGAAGILFVAAAGNSGGNNDATPVYPASYSDLDNIIAVTATDSGDALAPFANYGATNVDLGAPGVSIISCWDGSDGDYEYDDGTSMSAALVSGAAAILEAHFPDESYLQIRQRILTNVDPQPALQGQCVSGGRLNLYKALTAINIPPVTASFAANPSSGQVPLAVQFTDQSSGPVISWNWNFGDGSSSTSQNPSHTYNSAGSFTARLTVTGSSGQTNSTSHTITVTNIPPVTASFAANPSSGQAPLTVQFTDQSSGPVVSWNWNFGDGSSSTSQNPSHTYNSAGSFTARLTVTGSSGQTNSASHTITATNAPAISTVTVTAEQRSASSLMSGVFGLDRTNNTSLALTVFYSLSGTAQNGVDYQTLSGSVTFPAGMTHEAVFVQPLGASSVSKTVVLTISANPDYVNGSPNSATVTIAASPGS